MATPKFNSKSPTIKRILREAQELANSPSPDFHAAPASDSDLFDWHFTLRGPPSSPFSAGIYHGRIVLPPTYPLRPPSFRFLTPSGRFEVNREICLSISGHHEETWMPAWGVRTALVALRSFMETDVKGQLGGMECSAKEREAIAGQTPGWKCGVCAKSNGEIMKEAEDAAQAEGEVEEVEVPKELSMAFKDEMGKSAGKAKEKEEEAQSQTSPLEHDGSEEAELAEGFVQTGLDGTSDSHPPKSTSTATPTSTQTQSTYPPARPAQTAPQPTGASIPNAPRAAVANAYPTQQMAQRVSNDGVPVWVDRAIGAVIFCLVALFMKVLFGF
ncbi:related to non-canonical ubiquitin conjugating enzyme 1 [Rhynchosporium secalis]|uniref:Related to non-canonical ubiquitin conjugating enzyme 1 n=1 Tax=Rhynchosporium secalis TaxID=38038 RepID=A0A1E1MUQ3_RHYSE|nr:related to non-canonical ubiquitin conjugating enzyme 1 [Rhynchosporium secalis]